MVEKHRKSVVSIALQALGNRDDAQDAAQETFFYAVTHLSEVKDKSQFPSWLRSVTLSKCVDYRRRRGTRHLGEPISRLNEGSEVKNYLEKLTIKESLSQLSAGHRDAISLHYLGGWSLAEVAKLLDIPVNTVRSRLNAAKKQMRAEIEPFYFQRKSKQTMSPINSNLPESHASLLNTAFPRSRILSHQTEIEVWMPFNNRVKLALDDGSEREVDFRNDLTPDRIDLMKLLKRLGIPCSGAILPPKPDGGGGFLTLCEKTKGANLLLWAEGGTPHRVRLATERAFESIDRIQGVTQALLEEVVGKKLPRKSLSDEALALFDDGKWASDSWLSGENGDIRGWREDSWFQEALVKVRIAVADIDTPLVLTDYVHFFPNWIRIAPNDESYDEPLGWPGDCRYQDNPIVEYTAPYGYIGDPLLGLAMVWIYDCYPFIHTGFVEQFLWRRGVSRREFAPRLALQALKQRSRGEVGWRLASGPRPNRSSHAPVRLRRETVARVRLPS